MAEIGKMNKIKAVRSSENGMYLDGGELGEILLPNSSITEKLIIDEEIEVFIYHDHKQRLTATTVRPKGIVGEYVYLKTISVTGIGAFMDWGLQKDLFIPFAEQKETFEQGNSYLIYIYIDKVTGRMVGTAKVNKYLTNEPDGFIKGEEVEVLVCNKTDIGYNVIINDLCWGLIHSADITTDLRTNERMTGYIKNIKDDFKIDISFQQPSLKKVYELTDIIIDKIRENGGSLEITDKSSPDDIYSMFKVSKKVYKKSLGALYKQRIIVFEDNCVKLRNK